jgi:hypothetical protein
MESVEKALQLLKDKSKDFIVQAKTPMQVAKAIAFKQGINWAIDTIETEIENQKCEEQWRLEQLENENKTNPFKSE